MKTTMNTEILKKNQIWIGYDVFSKHSGILRPQSIKLWKEKKFKESQPVAPLHYRADALVGVSLFLLNSSFEKPYESDKIDYSFLKETWNLIDPHTEIYKRSQQRVQSLKSQLSQESENEQTAAIVNQFERNFNEILEASFHPWGVNLEHFFHLIEALDYLETKLKSPLLFDFSLKLNPSFIQTLLSLHSLLFHLRALIAIDYNAYINDPTFESLKVDSISDYLPKADYTLNDALLYLEFKKHEKHMDSKIYKAMLDSIKQYSHNSYCLVENLPNSFLTNFTKIELEDVLHITQMDWLLSSEAGLLYRIREELFGLKEGYENIFWPEQQKKSFEKETVLAVNCLLNEKELFPQDEAA